MRVLIAVLIILLLVLQYRLWFGEGSVYDAVQLRKQVEEQRVMNQKLEERNKILLAEIHDLKSGRQSIEEHARNDLGMVKNNETFYQVVK
jgi:cell division protein FtsB